MDWGMVRWKGGRAGDGEWNRIDNLSLSLLLSFMQRSPPPHLVFSSWRTDANIACHRWAYQCHCICASGQRRVKGCIKRQQKCYDTCGGLTEWQATVEDAVNRNGDRNNVRKRSIELDFWYIWTLKLACLSFKSTLGEISFLGTSWQLKWSSMSSVCWKHGVEAEIWQLLLQSPNNVINDLKLLPLLEKIKD